MPQMAHFMERGVFWIAMAGGESCSVSVAVLLVIKLIFFVYQCGKTPDKSVLENCYQFFEISTIQFVYHGNPASKCLTVVGEHI